LNRHNSNDVKMVRARQATICMKIGEIDKAWYGKADDVGGSGGKCFIDHVINQKRQMGEGRWLEPDRGISDLSFTVSFFKTVLQAL